MYVLTFLSSNSEDSGETESSLLALHLYAMRTKLKQMTHLATLTLSKITFEYYIALYTL